MSQTPTPGQLLEIRRARAIVSGQNSETRPECFYGPQGPIGPSGPTGDQGPFTYYIFDGGRPSSVYSVGPAFNAGGVGFTGNTGPSGQMYNGTNLQIQFRRGTYSEWIAVNPILAAGELVLETDTNLYKIGDGIHSYSDLPYGGLGATGPTGSGNGGGGTGYSGPTGPEGPTGTAGAQGIHGVTGPSGAGGPTGPQGTNGSIGSTGPSGAEGATGQTGSSGPQGPQGIPGTAVNTGATGPSGAEGHTGSQGPTGSGGGGTFGMLRIPVSGGNFVPASANSTVPSSFATYNSSLSDANTFVFNLNAKFTLTNPPIFIGTVMLYNGSQYNYLNTKYGLTTASGPNVVINSAVTTLSFTNCGAGNFSGASNDSSGYALYIILSILSP